MITGELQSKVDRIWDTMWSGGISNPQPVILERLARLDEEIAEGRKALAGTLG
jgi:hypothetical protein